VSYVTPSIVRRPQLIAVAGTLVTVAVSHTRTAQRVAEIAASAHLSVESIL